MVATLERGVAFCRYQATDVCSILGTGTGVPAVVDEGTVLTLKLPSVPTRWLNAYRLHAVAKVVEPLLRADFVIIDELGLALLDRADPAAAPLRGNRRINSVLYIASVTQHRDHDDARVYIERKLAEGKTRREARRAHKRHLANRVIRRMWNDESQRRERPVNIAS